LEISDANRETSAAENTVIPDMASSLQRTPQIKINAEGVLTIKKKSWSTPSSLSSDLSELSQLKWERMVDDKKYKIIQLSIEESVLLDVQKMFLIKTNAVFTFDSYLHQFGINH